TEVTVLTLLGTKGGPRVGSDRAGEASLLTVRGQHYLIDAGVGVERRLADANTPLASISKVFITHHHNDHTAGLFGLITLYSNRAGIEILGPPRTAEFVKGAVALAKINWEIRAEEGGLPVAQMIAMFKGRDVPPGLVYQDENVKVTAVENAHFQFPPGSPAAGNKSYAYRFQTPNKVIVFTGDTGAQASLAKFAEGADILVCEIVGRAQQAGAGQAGAIAQANSFHMVHEHLSPTEVGQLARDAHVKLLVLSHLVFASDADLVEIRKWYPGKVVMGEDLQVYK
ncbi:MAG: MBL fold metallo-hydrolase, partial [Caulobacteraceae bacterium]